MRSHFRRCVSLLPLFLVALSLAFSGSAHAQHHKRGAKIRHEGHARHHRVEGSVESAPKTTVQNSAPPDAMTTRGPARLDFDDRLVQGQSNKAGAIFLYDRKSLPLRSMVRTRTSFRDQIDDELPVEDQ